MRTRQFGSNEVRDTVWSGHQAGALRAARAICGFDGLAERGLLLAVEQVLKFVILELAELNAGDRHFLSYFAWVPALREVSPIHLLEPAMPFDSSFRVLLCLWLDSRAILQLT
ncbi:hypothetical protein [Nocardioides sp. GCM10030258]|uniref:hypothetical protein n=1 Tax=unclassified Nocardioides TaxID=2615069 RepID=UPI003616DF98